MGNILNSKTEYNRCHIPRLRIEEEEDTKLRKEQQSKDLEQIMVGLDEEQRHWEQARTTTIDKERRLIGRSGNGLHQKSSKRASREQDGEKGKKRSKKLKYELVGEDWGAPKREQHRTKEREDQEQQSIRGSRPEEQESLVEGAVRAMEEQDNMEVEQESVEGYYAGGAEELSNPQTPLEGGEGGGGAGPPQ